MLDNIETQQTNTESYISRFKTGNTMVDYMVMSMIVSLVTKVFTHIQFWFEYHFDWLKIVNYFSNKNSVSYEGKVCINYDRFSCHLTQSIVFSDQFKALWNHIIKDVDENDTIRHIKEYMFGTSNETIYMVNQFNQFLVCPKNRFTRFRILDKIPKRKKREVAIRIKSIILLSNCFRKEQC